MTTRERILTLYDGGTEPHMIAALLDLDVSDVAETLSDPGHAPSDPAGGSPVSYLYAYITTSAATATGVEGIVPDLPPGWTGRPETPSKTLTSGPLILGAGGFVGLEFLRPTSITQIGYTALRLCNADGSEQAMTTLGGYDVSGEAVGTFFRAAFPTISGGGHKGEDITLDEGQLVTAAGGVYWAEVLIELESR